MFPQKSAILSYSLGGSPLVWLVLLIQALLFVVFLPYWEGFDEPFHYGNVQDLSCGHLPNSARLPDEIWQSVLRSPASHVVQQNLPALHTYDELFRCNPTCAWPDVAAPAPANYEAHHPPLAYLILAPVEMVLSSWPVETRLVAMRLAAVLFGTLLTVVGWLRFSRRLELPRAAVDTGLFFIGSSPMYWATIDHVANDWLAVGIAALFLSALALPAKSAERCFEVCLLVLLGTLSKAYFLPLLLLGLMEIREFSKLSRSRKVILLLTASIAIAWYGKNLVAGNVMGLQELNRTPSAPVLINSGLHLDWAQELSSLLLSSIWTGNSSFLTYSRYLVWSYAAWLALGCAAFVLLIKRPILSPFAVVFSLALLGSVVLSNWFTGGRASGTSPWYVQPLHVCALFACVSVVHRLSRFYLLSGVIIATLIFIPTVPFKYASSYTAMSNGKLTVSLLQQMDWTELARRAEIVFHFPAWFLLILVFLSTLVTIMQAWRLIRSRLEV